MPVNRYGLVGKYPVIAVLYRLRVWHGEGDSTMSRMRSPVRYCTCSRVHHECRDFRPEEETMMSTTTTTGPAKQSTKGEDHDHEDIEPIVWTVAIFVAALGLYWSGNVKTALVFAAIGCLYLLSGSFFRELSEEDKLKIEYNIYSAEDGLENYLQKRTQQKQQPPPQNTSSGKNSNHRSKKEPSLRTAALALLPALAKKVSTQRTKHDAVAASNAMTQLAYTTQRTAYLALEDFSDDDEVIMASYAVLALIAKEASVQLRYIEESTQTPNVDDNDISMTLTVVVQAMQRALNRCKDYTDKHDEQLAAELQRKGCLLLGALVADAGDAATTESTDSHNRQHQLAALIVRNGGIDAIADALAWFRYHAEVVNWALWALFHLCYQPDEHPSEQQHRARILLDRAPLIVECMGNCGVENVAVARHGIAVLFQLLRNAAAIDQKRIQHTGEQLVAVGLEKVMTTMLETYPDASDIQLMGQEILSKVTGEVSLSCM